MNNLVISELNELKEGVFKEVVEKINKIESVSTTFSHTDLKIHNVSYYLHRAEQNGIISYDESINLFQHISDIEYEMFTEWEREILNYVERDYIGRTSSFYYNSKWYGNIIDNYTLESILKGGSGDYLKAHLSNMNDVIYEYLVKGNDIGNQLADYDEGEFLNQIECEEEFLNSFNDDLDTVLEIVNEARIAYKYLKEYKTEENEYYLAKEYLKHEIEDYYCDDKADKLFNNIIRNIDKLNMVEALAVNYTKKSNAKTYELDVVINDKSLSIDTEISYEHELSEKYINLVMESLKYKINESFVLK